MPPDPNMPWSWVPPEWNLSPVGLSPVYEEPEIVAPPLVVPSEPARMSAAPEPFAAKHPAVDDDPRLGEGNGLERAPSTEPKPINAARPDLTLDDVLAEKRAQYERFGASPKQIDGWIASERKRLSSILGARPPGAHITQSAGPMGTIGQIGKDETPGTGGLVSLPKEWSEGLTPEEKARAGLQDPRLSPDEEAQSDARAPGMPDEYLTGEELGQKLASLPPEQQVIERAKIEGARDKFARARMLEESERAMRAAEDNARAYQEAVKAANQRAADLDKEAQIIANENPLDRISSGRKIAGIIGAMLGGFTGATTGRNTGLDTIEAIANQAAQQHAQKLQLNARQQGAIGDQVARAGDMHSASEAVRLATYDTAVKTLESEVQHFDPRGTTAIRVMDDINAIKAKRAEALAKYRDAELKRTEGLIKEQRELAQLAETQRHNMAGEKTAATSAYADLLRAKTDQKKADAETVTYSPAQLQQLYGTSPDLVPPIPMTPKQYDAWLDAKKKGGDVTKAQRENSPDERARQFVVGDITDTEGKPIEFRDPAKVSKVMASSDLSVQLLDRLMTARQKYGWSSDLMKSPEWREMQSDFSQLLLEKKTLDELGVIAGPDMDLMQKALGTKDPTEYRDPTPGLRRIRDTTVEKVNTVLRAEAGLAGGRKVKRWDPPAPPPPAPKSPQQSSVQSILQFNPARPTLAESKEMGGVGKRDAVDGLPPSYAAQIDRLVDVFNSRSVSKEERDQAGAFLEELKNHGNSLVRAYATKAASAGAISSIPTGEP